MARDFQRIRERVRQETATASVRLATEGAAHELCQWETVQATCAPGQVVVATEATYGRMKKSRCVKRDFGFIGCQWDALGEVDKLCSGRQFCSFPVTNLHGLHDCPNDLTAYLRLSFKCVTVMPCQREMCEGSDYLQLTAPSGILSSALVADTGCGSQTCPWVLRARPGQHLNLTLMDFSHLDQLAVDESQKATCQRYVSIREDLSSKDVTSCSHDYARERHIYESTTNSIQLTLFADRESSVHYLIHYEVVGCPDFDPPQYAEVTREGSSVRVLCIASPEVYHLTCIGTEWQGKLGICPALQTDQNEDRFSQSSKSPFGMLVVVGVGVALGVVVGVLLLAAALLYMRRRSRESPTVNRNPLLFDASPFREMGKQYAPSSLIYTPEHNYTTTLHPKRPLPVPSPHVPSEETVPCRECHEEHRVPGKHYYETPSFPIQQMAVRDGRMHSADGIFRMEREEEHHSARTN
ncbi:hypothetical protein CAPTEDRAFT_225957 [Capitella teleta]|uniref:CUB domain-containing protein n=1 Tax=Capitella teleta TaxID=283909 RepID=R7TWI2_CAPTE|nr:hypothetical protein CAPTEDRAFT_225957 [Capitella teleta]|eukprot:ELT98119.1 hypothetical protein CAPTEDRAFT_225957 [Capitella teleta]